MAQSKVERSTTWCNMVALSDMLATSLFFVGWIKYSKLTLFGNDKCLTNPLTYNLFVERRALLTNEIPIFTTCYVRFEVAMDEHQTLFPYSKRNNLFISNRKNWRKKELMENEIKSECKNIPTS